MADEQVPSPAQPWFARLGLSGKLLAIGGLAGIIVAFLPLISVSLQTQNPGGVDPFGLLRGRGGANLPTMNFTMNVNETAMVVEDWRGAVAYINENVSDEDYVLVSSGLIESDELDDTHSNAALVDFSLLPVTSLYAIEAPADRISPLRTSDPNVLTRDQKRKFKHSRRTWMVLRGTASSTAESPNLAITAHNFGGVTVMEMERR